MIDRAWKCYIYETKGIDKIYNSKDEITSNIRFKIVINTRRDAFKTIMNNEYIIQLVDLLNCKNYHVLEDYYGHIKFIIGTNCIARKILLPKIILDKDVKEINVQNFPFDIWKIKMIVLDSKYYRQSYVHDDIAYNLEIKDDILYNTNEVGEVATYIELHICKDYILEKDCFKDIDEYTDYILDRYNSGAKKLYDWAASLE